MFVSTFWGFLYKAQKPRNCRLSQRWLFCHRKNVHPQWTGGLGEPLAFGYGPTLDDVDGSEIWQDHLLTNRIISKNLLENEGTWHIQWFLHLSFNNFKIGCIHPSTSPSSLIDSCRFQDTVQAGHINHGDVVLILTWSKKDILGSKRFVETSTHPVDTHKWPGP